MAAAPTLLGALAAQGSFDPPFLWPDVPVHLLHHPTGQILWWSYDGPSARLWDVERNRFIARPNHDTNIFCSGHAGLSDGRYVVAGGTVVRSTQIYDYVLGQWQSRRDMAFDRFYPTCTTLDDGRVLAVSGWNGSNQITIPEVYDPPTGRWTMLPRASLALPLYPFMFLLPDGTVLFAGPGHETWVLDVAGQAWTRLPDSRFDGGSAVMLRPGVVMKCGAPHHHLGTETTEILDLTTGARPQWVEVGPMRFPRADHNLTLLPDGRVLVTGGMQTPTGRPVLHAEVFDPATRAWSVMAAMVMPRLYHSTAQLLIDGRVVVAGGDGQPSAEIYNPPYTSQSRPQILAADNVFYGRKSTIRVDEPEQIGAVHLVRLGAVTHSFDQNQRLVPLAFEVDYSADPPVLVAQPPSATEAPPGAYMLFVVKRPGIVPGDEVPSVGRYVFVGR